MISLFDAATSLINFRHLCDVIVRLTKVDVEFYLQTVRDPAAVEDAIKGFEERLVEAEQALVKLP